MLDHLSAAFSAASPIDKAMFLARVAHNSTLDARAYAYDPPHAAALRHYNEFIHRVTGYMMQVLDRTAIIR
jgi:hypothetical protein